jgi:hypothetical protein
MTGETPEQMKTRLKRQDEEKEKAFQKTLEEIRKALAPFRAEQEEKKRAEEAERQKLHEDARQKREQEMRDSARMSWLAAGGTGEDFEQEWPGIRTEMLRRRTLEADANARAAQRRSGISSI